MIRTIEKVIDATRTKDGGLVVRGENAPTVYCCFERKPWNRKYNNIEEVVIKKSNVLSTIATLHDAGCCLNIV